MPGRCLAQRRTGAVIYVEKIISTHGLFDLSFWFFYFPCCLFERIQKVKAEDKKCHAKNMKSKNLQLLAALTDLDSTVIGLDATV